MKWSVFLIVILIILLLQPLPSLYTQSFDDCCFDRPHCVIASNGYVNVNVSEAKQMIEANLDLIILDVRTLEEYKEGHIDDTVLIPVSELESRLDELDIEDEILVYCRSGGRSATASQILVDNGFTSVYNMLGGITAWRNEGYWIEIIHEGDLVIDGTQTYVIENCAYVQTGPVFVTDPSATLVIVNAAFTLIYQEHDIFRGFHIDGELTMENVELISLGDNEISMDVYRQGKANLKGVQAQKEDIYIRLTCYHDSSVEIVNSTFWVICAKSDLTLEDAYVSKLELVWRDTIGVGYIEEDASVTILSSTIGCVEFVDWCRESTVLTEKIQNAKPDLYENWVFGSITFNNCLLGGFLGERWILSFSNVSATISNSDCHVEASNGDSDFSIDGSECELDFRSYSSNVFLNDTVCDQFGVQYSELFIHGNSKIERIRSWEGWIRSNVTRNYSLLVRNTSDISIANAELTLSDQNDTVVWTGNTDSLGEASFNLTFTDGNYTDTLRLEAHEGSYSANYSAIMNVGFLCDTPIVLTMRYFADLNGDGTINIVDVSIVAVAFGTEEGDENYNPIADLDDNRKINIVDVSIVALDYGKTV